MDSSSPARDRTLAPCSGRAESQPLDHQGCPLGSPASLAGALGPWALGPCFCWKTYPSGLNFTGMPFCLLLHESLKLKDCITLIFVSLAPWGLCQHQSVGWCTKHGSLLYTRAVFTNSKVCKALGRGFARADRTGKVSRVVGTAGTQGRV